MAETSARLLRLLSLLQARRHWTGPELAERLDVTTRTIRNDVERLRGLGYPVDATPGVSGGYRLGVGAAMPPLLLDDEEAVAVAMGLRTAAGGTIAGIEETSVRALAKLEQVLPSRLRRRVEALNSATLAVQGGGPTVDAEVLSVIANACRDRETLRFDYVGHHGSETRRQVEPHRLVHMSRRWYLVGWDADRRDWRTFRADRVRPRTPNGRRFEEREPPEGGVVAYLQRGVGAALWRHHATIRLHAPAAEAAAKVPPAVVVEAVDERTCVLKAGADTLEYLALYLGMLDTDFDVVDSPDFAGHLRKLIGRFSRAVDS
ncbi:WYL domain-containing protein [Amycolatopsis sp. QT-25]|uniref:helix-turn-helix transcriptional regulator n=1 Tax=Amycolatopsis sp. QT-25 TaxID=3034022 RepID=UPI0023EB47EA|nr:WYL domain-containing protein [Amycolatopsis sp. QT-25]WET81298.1 WYL domain-containing protein [Amycolatopsis sp. QT-25]